VPLSIETIRQNDGSVEEAASCLEIPVEQLEAATEAPGQRDRAADCGAEVADFQGLGNAAEWSRTITSR
jgi:hypothetical protein